MAKRIVTKNKNDIVTGFDVTCKVNLYDQMMENLQKKLSKSQYDFLMSIVPKEGWYAAAEDAAQQIVPQLKNLLDKAEEIFIEEASLSRWSGNMIDNSVCGISGIMPTVSFRGRGVYMNVRVGVNHKQIMNKANWTSRPPIRFRKNHTIYEYGGKRMHQPPVDYSVFLERGTAQIPNAAAWAGFVERAEERFNAL